MVIAVEPIRRWAYARIPDSVKDGNKPDEIMHAYVILGLLLASMGLCILGALFMPFALGRTLATSLLGGVVAIICGGFYYLSLKAFQRTASFTLAGNLYAIPSYCGILIEIFLTGGFDSPFVALMLTIPVLAFVMGGRKTGTLWVAIVLGSIAWLFSLTSIGHEAVQMLKTAEARQLWWLLSWLMVGVVNAAALLVYDLVNHSLADRLHSERNKFAFQAAHDPLTRIANRDTFEQALRETIDRCRESDREKAVLVYIDLDHFKEINDQYGHQTGDQVLKAVAERIGNAVRSTDIVARLGGDEFALLLNVVEDGIDVQAILDTLVERVASPIRTREATVTITCSVGAVVCPDHGTDPETLAAYADELMYKAKEKQNSFVYGG